MLFTSLDFRGVLSPFCHLLIGNIFIEIVLLEIACSPQEITRTSEVSSLNYSCKSAYTMVNTA